VFFTDFVHDILYDTVMHFQPKNQLDLQYDAADGKWGGRTRHYEIHRASYQKKKDGVVPTLTTLFIFIFN